MIARKNKYYNQLTFGLSSLFSVQTCKKLSGVRLIAPFYHSVSDKKLPHIEPLYNTKSVEQFKQDLIQLQNHFEFVDAGQFKALTERKSSKSVAFLSFDDGLKECHSVIRPILKELSIPACFFINRDFINGQDVFYRYKVGSIISELQKEGFASDKTQEVRNYLKDKNLSGFSIEHFLMNLTSADEAILNELIRLLDISDWKKDIYMSELEVQELVNEGFNIGGHSLDHVEFSNLNTVEILDQIKNSVDYCQENYGESMRLFAFPFFDYDMGLTIFNSMFDKLNIDLSFGTSGLKKDVFNQSIQRLDMEDNSGESKTFLKNALFIQGVRRLIGNDKMKR